MFEHQSHIKKITMLGLAALCLTAGSAVTQAAEITVTGSTAASLNGGAMGCTESYLGLTYTCTPGFSATTVGGFAAVGGFGGTNDNFGTFTLSTATNIYSTIPIQLKVTFTAPTGVSGGQTATFTGVFSGAVNNTQAGGVFVDFDNTPKAFSYANGTSSGTFTLALNDVSVKPGQQVSITGNITGQSAARDQVPEPATMALMGAGLLGVAGLGRKFRRS